MVLRHRFHIAPAVTVKYLGTTVTNQNLIQEEIEFWSCLLPFGPEPSVFSVAVEKLKN
jgi:hypothetical protein